jgi:hypothetical protein
MPHALGKAKELLTAVQTFGPQASVDEGSSYAQRAITAIAVSFAVLVVALIAVLMGMD